MVLILIGCAGSRHENTVSYDPQFETYIQDFNQIHKIDDLSVILSEDLPDLRLGVCNKIPDKTPEITIRRSYWMAVDTWGKRALLFHELGHCVLNLLHNDTKPGIMNTTALQSSQYNETTYLEFDAELK